MICQSRPAYWAARQLALCTNKDRDNTLMGKYRGSENIMSVFKAKKKKGDVFRLSWLFHRWSWMGGMSKQWSVIMMKSTPIRSPFGLSPEGKRVRQGRVLLMWTGVTESVSQSWSKTCWALNALLFISMWHLHTVELFTRSQHSQHHTKNSIPIWHYKVVEITLNSHIKCVSLIEYDSNGDPAAWNKSRV